MNKIHNVLCYKKSKMNLEINMINVEDGDAIILMLEKNENKALVLIDGGYKLHYCKLKRRIDELLPSFNNRIDLIICTHYDNDHLGGIEHVIDDYHSIIQKIWIHRAMNTLNEEISILKEKLNIIEQTEHELNRYNNLAGIDGFQNLLIVEGYKDLIRVIEKLINYGLANKVYEPRRGDYLEGFEELMVISPTVDFYNSNLELLKTERYLNDIINDISERKLLLERSVELVDSKSTRKYMDMINPCSKLETSSIDNNVTAANLLSIVTLVNIDSKRFLFTGDSGIETFEKQNILDDNLKDLEWLDLPHHGSKNNTSAKMLSHFNSKTVFVSGKGIYNRPHSLILNCLKNKRRMENVYITNSEPDTWYLKYDSDGNFQRVNK